MKFSQTIRNLALIFIIIYNVYIFYYINSVDNKEESSCSDSCKSNDWEKTYLKSISLIFAIVAFVNIFIPINRWLSKLIVVGGAFALAIVVLIALQVYTLIRYFKKMNSDECNTCLSVFNKNVTQYMLSIGTPVYIIAVIVIAQIFAKF